jgi:ATP-dependent exoDNAse (exonuclease V) alpha subunit
MATSGFVQAVDQEAQELVLNFDGHLVNYDFGELDEIVPAYAITIHKSPGSEYPAVVIPLSMQHYLMLRRNTGITRGKRLVVLVGQRKAWRLRSGIRRPYAAVLNATSRRSSIAATSRLPATINGIRWRFSSRPMTAKF